ncbi:MAG: ATP-binding cassette domain-containing protein, partial [Oscillospiraceae bacterium]|nr:ATP-binding cassette domain-containing protein [Oscillospiraceae bacterium]
MEEILQIRNFSFAYPDQENLTLSGIDLTFRQGEFVVLCGASGSGKTTLLRQLKPVLAPHGRKSGEILFHGVPLNGLNARDSAVKIGFVQQNPENQIVADKVWHELAFGLESLGLDTSTIRLRTAETASFFGIQEWFHKNTTELSGGQKQLLALAGVMAMQPELLILDEPTSQLDPIAASEFLGVVGKINRELGVTVLLTEHRLEEAFPLCSRAVVLEEGRILCGGTPREMAHALRGHGMFLAMPTPIRVWSRTNSELPCPVTVGEGRNWLSRMKIVQTVSRNDARVCRETPVIAIKDAWFRYEKDAPDVLKGLNFTAYSGEITAILGGNGTGKTTALSLMLGLRKPQRGKVLTHETRIAAVPQNPQTLFTEKTVEADLLEILAEKHLSKTEKRERAQRAARLCRLTGLLRRHPYDLSGGEQQRAALAKVLLLEPKILLLDEPTKGLDAQFKRVFAGILRQLADDGTAVILVSHDIEFCAETCDTCALFFDGAIVTQGDTRTFFLGNSFYTTAANRMAHHVLPEATTAEDVIFSLGGDAEDIPPCDVQLPRDCSAETEHPNPKHPPKLGIARKIVMGICGAAFLAGMVLIGLRFGTFSDFLSGGSDAVNAANDPAAVRLYVGTILALTLATVVFMFCLSYKRERTPFPQLPPSRKLPKRTVAAAVMILLLIPLTIFAGIVFWDDRKYYFIGLLVILEAMPPFAFTFEKRKPQAREMVILAVLTAIAATGRTVFFMLPQFKPVTAKVSIAGVAFRGEAGYLEGAL